MGLSVCATGARQSDFAGFIARHEASASPLEMWIDTVTDGTVAMLVGLRQVDADAETAEKFGVIVRALWSELAVKVRDPDDPSGEPMTEDTLPDFLHVVLRAIEAHMRRSQKHELGHARLYGGPDDLPRSILLDYFEGTLSFTYPVWHQLDLSQVALDVPPRHGEGEGVETGIAYVFQTKPSKKTKVASELIAAGVARSTLYVGSPKWMATSGRARAYASRDEALQALSEWCAEQARAGLVLRERSPLSELRRSAKQKFPAWSFG